LVLIRNLVNLIFLRIQLAEKQYKDSFDEELNMFKDRIRKRAEEKLRIAQAEIEEEERKARLGPGGLDPVEVFESLPDVRSLLVINLLIINAYIIFVLGVEKMF